MSKVVSKTVCPVTLLFRRSLRCDSPVRDLHRVFNTRCTLSSYAPGCFGSRQRISGSLRILLSLTRRTVPRFFDPSEDGRGLRPAVITFHLTTKPTCTTISRELAQLPHLKKQHPVQPGLRSQIGHYWPDHVLMGAIISCQRLAHVLAWRLILRSSQKCAKNTSPVAEVGLAATCLLAGICGSRL